MANVNERSFPPGGFGGVPEPARRQPPAPRLRGGILSTIALAFRTRRDRPAPDHAAPDEIVAFSNLAVGDDDNAAFAYVETLRLTGASIETILLDWLAPAARHLGALWETDAVDFVTVTLGVSRLQRIMRRLGEALIDSAPGMSDGHSVLLTIIPGEQHSFGLSMVAEFFRRAGWHISTGPFASHQELATEVAAHWFDIVGFSVSSDRRLAELRHDISAIRTQSCNRHVGIMLGGPMIALQPELMATMGADLLATDAATAPLQADRLVHRLSGTA